MPALRALAPALDALIVGVSTQDAGFGVLADGADHGVNSSSIKLNCSLSRSSFSSLSRILAAPLLWRTVQYWGFRRLCYLCPHILEGLLNNLVWTNEFIPKRELPFS
jgi:hypothetical protein